MPRGPDKLGWLDVEEIAERLAAEHPSIDPMSVRFTQLRGLVERLEGFEADPDHPVNERILETIQGLWMEMRGGGARGEEDE